MPKQNTQDNKCSIGDYYQCNICNSNFKSRKNITKHMLDEHMTNIFGYFNVRFED